MRDTKKKPWGKCATEGCENLVQDEFCAICKQTKIKAEEELTRLKKAGLAQ